MNVVREGASGDSCGDDDKRSMISEHEEAERIVEAAEAENAINCEDPPMCVSCESDAPGGSHEETTETVKGYKSPQTPFAPSRQERAEHNVAHCPFRSWCAHCVAGKGKGKPHFASTPSVKEAASIPLIGVDYAFVNNTNADDEEWAEIKIMAIKDSVSKYVFAIPVPVKGLGESEWAVKRLIKAI